MKADLVVELIKSHCRKNEKAFADSVEKLAEDEIQSNHLILANRLRRSYTEEFRKSLNSILESDSIPSPLHSFDVFAGSSIPRDKDNSLQLFEILNPDNGLEKIFLPIEQHQMLEGIIKEQLHREELFKHRLYPTNRLLFCGLPGSGKTETALALAFEMKIQVAYVRLDGLVSSYLGQTSTNLRKVFDFVKNKKIMLFLDEFDAIAKKRDDSNELGELKRVVTTLIQNMDSLPSTVFLVAATNHPHLLDSAIWRRFNKTIQLDLPDEEIRKDMLFDWLKNFDIDTRNLDPQSCSMVLTGLSGGQIKEIAMEVAKLCILSGKPLENDNLFFVVRKFLTNYNNGSEALSDLVYKLRQNNVSWRRIAEISGKSLSTVHYMYQKMEKQSP